MKVLFTMLAVLCLAIPAQGEVETMAGTALGYTFSGPGSGAKSLTAVAGTVLKSGETWKLFTLARYTGNEESTESWWGAEGVLSNHLKNVEWLWFNVGVGVLDNAYQNMDGSTVPAITFKAGLSLEVGDVTSITGQFEVVRRGPEWDAIFYILPAYHVNLLN